MSTRNDLIKAIESQLQNRNPEISSITLARLMNDGAPRELAISKMADALFEHMTQMLKDDEKFIEAKFIDRMNQIEFHKNSEL